MKTSKQLKEKSQVLLTVHLTESEMSIYKQKTVKELQEKVKVDGFRPGHIPEELLIKQMGEQGFMTEVIDHALRISYEEALEEEKLRPLDYPKIKLLSHEPLAYEALVAVFPEIKWKKDVKKLRVKKEKVEVGEKDIKNVLEDLQKRFKKWKEVDRKSQKGDKVEIDFDGFSMEGEALPGTQSKNHPLVLGEGNFIPGFEEEVMGLKVGEEKDFDITFPKDYHAPDFKGRKVKFKIKVHKIEEAQEAEINDDLAVEVTGGAKKTLAELKEEIKEELTRHKGREEKARREEKFLESLKTFAEAEIPEVMVERELEFMMSRLPEPAKKDKTPEELKKEFKGQAEDQVLLRMAIEKLHEEMPLEVSDQEVLEELSYRLDMFPRELRPMVIQRYEKGGQDHGMLVAQVKLSKLVEAHTEA